MKTLTYKTAYFIKQTSARAQIFRKRGCWTFRTSKPNAKDQFKFDF